MSQPCVAIMLPLRASLRAHLAPLGERTLTIQPHWTGRRWVDAHTARPLRPWHRTAHAALRAATAAPMLYLLDAMRLLDRISGTQMRAQASQTQVQAAWNCGLLLRYTHLDVDNPGIVLIASAHPVPRSAHEKLAYLTQIPVQACGGGRPDLLLAPEEIPYRRQALPRLVY